MKRKEKIVLGVAVTIFLSLAIVANIIRHDKEPKVTSTIPVKGFEATSNPSKEVDITPTSESEETVLPPTTRDDKISKLWFDLRNGDGNSKKLMEDLVSEISADLSEGSTPQVIGSFLIKSKKSVTTGFSLDEIKLGDRIIKLLTIVGPSVMKEDRARMIVVDGKATSYLGSVPLIMYDYGVSDGRLLLGGYNLGTPSEGKLALAIINLHSLKLENIDPVSNPNVKIKPYWAYYSIGSDYSNYYFFGDHSSGNVGDLLLILESDDKDSYHNYIISIRRAKLELEEISYDGVD